MLAQEIETSEPMLFETPAAQKGSAVACHEQVMSPPVTTRELFVLWYPRCERCVSFHRVTLRCKPLCIANPRVRRSTVHHTPPCALRRGSGTLLACKLRKCRRAVLRPPTTSPGGPHWTIHCPWCLVYVIGALSRFLSCKAVN